MSKSGCNREFAYLKDFIDHVDKIHNTPYGENIHEEHKTNIKKSWVPKNFSFASKITQLVAELRITTNVNGTDLGTFINSLENVLRDAMSDVTTNIEEYFVYRGIDTSEKEVKSFLNQFQFHDSFRNFQTVEGQIQALQSTYSYVEPKEEFLGQRLKKKLNKNTAEYEVVLKNDTFQYIPLIDTLTLVLSNDEVM